jgi:hypothetical protein
MAVSPQHVTLVAATVTTVTFDQDFDAVEVLVVVPGPAPVYFTANGVTPVAAAGGTQVLPVAIGALKVGARPVDVPGVGLVTQVKLITASGTPQLSVRGINL